MRIWTTVTLGFGSWPYGVLCPRASLLITSVIIKPRARAISLLEFMV